MLRKLTQEDIDSGDLLDADEFVGSCVIGGFIDYDGFGYPVFDDEIDEKEMISPSDVVENGLDDAVTHVLWFNR